MSVGARRRSRRGFTLVEVIVALAVILILAAVALPQMAGYLDQRRIEEARAQLEIVRDALYNPATTTDFRSAVGNNAGRLSQLVYPLTSSDLDACNSSYTGGQRNDWPGGGPFVNFMIDPTSGMATPIGQAQDDIERVSVGGTWVSRVIFPNTVALADAQALDLLVDGTADYNAGMVRWTPQLGTDGVVTMYYHVPIDAQC
jgi:prepilin-type N-terminal cleavage/methylation domain-containing protein